MTFAITRARLGDSRNFESFSNKLFAGCLATALAWSLMVLPARAQSLDQAVVNALTGNCAALGGAGNTRGGLNTICAAAGGATSSDGGNTNTASQSDLGSDDQESKIKKRLQHLRDKSKSAAANSDGSSNTAGDQTGWRVAGPATANSDGASNAEFQIGGLSAFASFDYQNVDKHTTSLTNGFNSDKYGGTLGADYSFGNAVLGAAFNAARTNADFASNGGNFNTNTYGGYLYGSLLPTENIYIDGIVGYNHNATSLSRNAAATIAATVFTGTETSSPSANEFKAGISSGYDFSYSSFTFGPRVGLNYTRNAVAAFNESGTSGLELAFNSQTFNSLTSSVGAHVTTAISTGFGVLVPQASADYIHEFAENQQTFSAHFVDDTKATPTNLSFQNDSPSRNYVGLGIGMVMVLPHGISPYVNYRALVGDALQTTQTVTAGLRVEF